MKCYTIQAGGKLTKSMSLKPIMSLLDETLAKRKTIATAYLEFVPLPIISVKDAMAKKNGFSYGNVSLHAAMTPFQRIMKFGKTTVLVLYEHSKFYPDRLRDADSRDVWMDEKHCLLLGMEGKIFLKEIKSGISYGIGAGKVVKTL